MKTSVYLAGGMEAESGLGAGWREQMAAELAKLYDLTILNPVEFEPKQLQGLRPNRLPEEMETIDGKKIKPKHWHQLKLSPRTSSLYSRFKRYVRKIIHYDIGLIESKVDYVICYWTEGAVRGAGTHSELTAAFRKHIPVYTVIADGVELPGWLHGTSTRVFDSFDELYRFLRDEFCDYEKEQKVGD